MLLANYSDNKNKPDIVDTGAVMTSQSLLLEGLELMLFGMGLVFLFLVLLILCVRFLSYLIARFLSEEISAASVVAVSAQVQTNCAAIDTDTLNAIQLAIRQHRDR